MYDCVMIGSMAAKIGGFLPPWRNGHVGDIDLICTRDAAREIAAAVGVPMAEHVPGRVMVTYRRSVLDIWIDDRPPVEWAGPLEDIEIDGLALKTRIGTIEAVWAFRAISVGFVPSMTEKALRDTAHYDSVISHADCAALRFMDDRRRKANAALLQGMVAKGKS